MNPTKKIWGGILGWGSDGPPAPPPPIGTTVVYGGVWRTGQWPHWKPGWERRQVSS